ncbi:hypothetical protein Pmani_018707 [Petrolisthes manimaculis]|uniref:Uncharacterized protein n=1 Tax=Petrolisthes manimaculis TaxID=1843537 RepID=A0AAE1PLZ3_9EUCA|nr:hypothetical protein Pmani_018707 [Petrolisthes manimaculis]
MLPAARMSQEPDQLHVRRRVPFYMLAVSCGGQKPREGEGGGGGGWSYDGGKNVVEMEGGGDGEGMEECGGDGRWRRYG